MTILSQINTVETKGKKVASTTIATTSKSTVVNTNVYPQVKWGAVRRGKGNRNRKAGRLYYKCIQAFSHTTGQFMSHHYR